MWRNVTVFSGGDLCDGEKWEKFMREEHHIFDDESASEAVESRKEEILACISRLQEELENLDRLETLLHD